MSKKVDERVVEMRFDNQQFESATKQTMSTLDKLKAALKFPSSSKSLESISSAAKKVDFSGMNKGIETVNAKFSAMQVIGMTALSNITSAAMRAGSNLVKSFTLDPIVSGFQEYETQLNSVQTILANTSSKGTTIDDVTAALDELNTYADQTIYNFTEMTRNIGTFTAAGVDLDKSVSAIKGIANLAAVSGSSSTQASTAMYQLSQALAAGRVSLMDWNSVVNAGMGGEVFQNALKRTAKVMGKDVDAIIEKYGSFRESLTSGEWLTTDVLTETLKQFTMAAEEGSKEWDEFKKSLMDTGYTEDQAIEILKMANTATDAATKVKTFTQLMDTLKEAMGSGWAKTWQLIFGDFEEAKAFWTEMSDMFSGIINNFSDSRNNVIEQAMGGGGSRWGEFEKELKDAGSSVDDFKKKLADVYKAETGGSLDDLIAEYETLEKAVGSGKISAEMMSEALGDLTVKTEKVTGSTKSLAEWQKVVDDVWYGTYGNIDTGRVEKLAAAGWEYAEVQKLVNMTVDGHRLTLEDLTEAQLISIGYTEEQSKALAALAKEASTAGSDMNTLINDLLAPKKSGRELFLEGIKNILEAIMKPLGKVADAFNDVFAIDADGLYDIIKAFNEFSKSIIMSDDDAENLGKTFRGLFSVIKLIASLVGGTFTAGLKAANAVLAPFGTRVLGITGFLGDLLYAFEEWISSGAVIEGAISRVGDALSWLVDSFGDLPIISDAIAGVQKAFGSLTDYIKSFESMSPAEKLSKVANDIKGVFENLLDNVKDVYNKLKNLTWEDVLKGLTEFGKKVGEFFTDLIEDMKEIGPDILEGLQNGLKDGFDGVIQFLMDLGSRIIEAICAVLGIHSPSTVFFEIGTNIIQGLINGIKYLSGEVSGVIYDIVEDIKYALSGIDWGVVLPVAGAAASFAVLYQMTDALQGFATAAKQFSSPFQSIANLGGSLKTTVDGFNNLMGFTQNNTSIKFKQMAEGIKILAEAIAILAGSVVALTLVDTGKMWIAVGAIGALAVIIGALAAALNKFANGGTILQSLQLNTTLLSIAGSFLLLSVAAKILGTMDGDSVDSAVVMLAAFTGVVSALIGMSKFAGGKNLNQASSFLKQVSVCFLLLSASAKLLGTMDSSEMTSAGIMLAAFTGVVSALIAVTKFAGKDLRNVSKIVKEVGTAFLLLSVSAKLLGSLDEGQMTQAISGIFAFGVIVAALMAATNAIGGKNIDEIGDTISKVAGAIAILAVVAVVLGLVDTGQLIKGGVAVAALGIIVVGLMKLVQMMGPGEAAKVGATLLAMSLAIGVLGGIAVLLGLVDPGNLAKGVIAVGFLSAMMVAMTKATAGASDVKGSFLGIAVAIGVMAAAVAVLSFIDTGRLAAATAALTVLMLSLAAVATSMWGLNDIYKTLITLAMVIGVIGTILYLLAGLPVEGVATSAASLSVVLLSLAGALKIIDGVEDISKNVLISVGILTAVVAALGGVLILMSVMNVQSAIPNALALSTMLLAMSAAMVILDQVGDISTTVMGAMGILTAVMAGLAVVLGMLQAMQVESAIPKATALSIMLVAMSAVTLILSKVGAGATAAMQGALALMGVIVVIGVVIGAIGALANQFESIGAALDTGTEIMNKIGYAIGSFVSSIGEGLTSGLPQIASNLSSFVTNLNPFIEGMKGIDPSIGTTISNLGTGLLALTAGGLLDQLTQFFGGQSNLSALAEGLPQFGEAMAAFADSLSGVDLGALLIGSQAAKALADMATSMPKEGGILDSIFGSTVDLGTFGENLTQFGDGMKSYADSIAGVDVAAIQNSIPAAEGLAELANKLPAEGGLMQSIFGTQADLSTFGDQLIDFGDGLQQYASKVAGLDTESIEASIPAAEALNNLAQKLPSGGGLMESIFGGKDDLSDFGGQLTTFGQALLDYANKVVDLDTAAMENSISATNAVLNVLRSYANADDIDTGITNANKIKDVGGALKAYSDQIAGVDSATITASASAINGLKDAINNLVGLDSSGIAGFQSAIDSLASTNVQGLIDAFQGVDLSSIGANIMTTLANGITAGTAKVTSTLTAVVTAMTTLLNVQAALLTPIGLLYMTNLANGVRSGSSTFASALSSAISLSITTIRGFYSSFYSAGSYISSGLAAGMSFELSSIRSAASQMAQAAATATRAAALVSSPSRVFMEIGGYMGQGLVIGMENEQRAVYKAGYAMGDSAYDGLTETVSRLGDVLSSDLDVNPTIRPVLDLSDVRNGANSINSMFNASVPMNIMGDISSINRSMNDRIQNGTFKDVVDAVDKLRSGLADISGPSYTINGITYDDGSNIAAAVGGLTRAIRLEGRV